MTSDESSIADVIVFLEKRNMEGPVTRKRHLRQRHSALVRSDHRLLPALEVTAGEVESFTFRTAGSHERDFSCTRVQDSNVIVLIIFGVVSNLGECHASVD